MKELHETMNELVVSNTLRPPGGHVYYMSNIYTYVHVYYCIIIVMGASPASIQYKNVQKNVRLVLFACKHITTFKATKF